MTIFSDERKQLEKIERLLADINVELSGHNGDCYCDFCTSDNTQNIQSDCIDFWWTIKQKLCTDE